MTIRLRFSSSSGSSSSATSRGSFFLTAVGCLFCWIWDRVILGAGLALTFPPDPRELSSSSARRCRSFFFSRASRRFRSLSSLRFFQTKIQNRFKSRQLHKQVSLYLFLGSGLVIVLPGGVLLGLFLLLLLQLGLFVLGGLGGLGLGVDAGKLLGHFEDLRRPDPEFKFLPFFYLSCLLFLLFKLSFLGPFFEVLSSPRKSK